jgi:hypothetical protein
MKPRKTYARFHYGYGVMTVFREGIDHESDAVYDYHTGQKLCYNRIEWFIRKVGRSNPPRLPAC